MTCVGCVTPPFWNPRHPVGLQLRSVVARFRTPKQCLHQVIDGVAMDLAPRRFETWPELAHYCDLVAGAVGRAAVRVFGLDDLRADQYAVAEARTYAQSYESVFGEDVPPSFIDLGHFTELLASESSDPNVTQAAEAVQAALAQAVLAEMHGDDRPTSSGLTIYFPNSELYDGTFGERSSRFIHLFLAAGEVCIPQ